uniref:FAD binding domain-containing protein n=1 Tax=Nonomuraea lactucae TaxID=2249762 RepID=UPI001964B38B
MIPAQFEYVRASSLDEACLALAADEDAKVLAGGQSLLPLLRLRLAYPSTLVDIGRLPELSGVHDRGDHVYIGAMTTHDEVMRSDVVNGACPLVALATATVADPAVRHRGTFGGSLAHGDPA